MQNKINTNNSNKFKKFYKTFTSIIGTISLLIAVILGFIELYKFIFDKEYNLDVNANFILYEINDSLYLEIDKFLPKYDSIVNSSNLENNAKNLILRHNTIEFIDLLLNKMKKYDYLIQENVSESIEQINKNLYPQNDSINDKFEYPLNYYLLKEEIVKIRNNLHYTTYILKLEIKNNGFNDVSDLFLKINSRSGFYKIREHELSLGEPGYTEQISDFLENIEIGKIEAKDVKYITVWIKKPTTKENIKLTHSGKMLEIDFMEFGN